MGIDLREKDHASDKEVTTGWEGDDELGSEDWQVQEAEKGVAAAGAGDIDNALQPMDPAASPAQSQLHVPQAPAADTATRADKAAAAAAAAAAQDLISVPDQTADVGRISPDEHEQNTLAMGALMGSANVVQSGIAMISGDSGTGPLLAPAQPSSSLAKPDTPPLSSPKSPHAAASMEAPQTEPHAPGTAEQEDALNALHLRRPSDDIESTASTSQREMPTSMEADVDSGIQKGIHQLYFSGLLVSVSCVVKQCVF
jgi:hypothetical protein